MNVCIEPLDVRYCATEGDKVSDPIILHDSASRLGPQAEARHPASGASAFDGRSTPLTAARGLTMPKSRGRKNRRQHQRATRLKLTERSLEILEGQRQRFKEKFGRDWGPNDPIFFDPDASEPMPYSTVKMEAEVVDAMRKAGAPPQIIYAYKKTGLIYVKGVSTNWPKDRVQEWEAAIDEYFAIEDATKDVDKPDPEEWSTEIPAMLAAGFDKADLEKVREILAAMAPIEGREPTKVVVRIELAAAFLATACSAAYDSAGPIGSPDSGPELYTVTEALVVKRAREIYGQGRG